MRKPKGVSFNPWSTCERCGFTYPIRMLVVQKGLRVCTLFCFDNLDIEYRPFIIEQVLNDDAREGMPVTPELYQTQDEEVYF